MSKPVINAKTEVYAILGDPISHSLSPVMMNSMFNRLNMDKVFLAFRANLSNVDLIMQALKMLDLKGYVLTMPVKEHVLKYLDCLNGEAEIIRAVNCVCNVDGKLIGYNTDSIGFWNAIQEANTNNRSINKVFVLGAGGFAKAAVAQAALQGVKEIVVSNILSEEKYVASFKKFLERLVQKVSDVNVKIIDWDPQLWIDDLKDADVVANATPNGMRGQGDLHIVFPYEATNKDAIIFDAIYEPLITDFLAKAREYGFTTVEGLDLLVHQGVCSFKNWTGIDVSPAEMRSVIIKFFQKNE